MKTQIALGKKKNKYYYIDINSYPNILITGLDDYSKSDLINNILYQIISQNNNNEIKILPIDVKGIDFKLYDSSLHFLTPIIKKAKYVPEVLEGLITEIKRRKNNKEKLPLVILLIPEFDDLILNTGPKVLSLIQEILLLGKDNGIYTIMSTLYLDEKTYEDYIYKHFDLVASFFDRSESKFNKFKFICNKDVTFVLESKDKKIDTRLKNIIITNNKIISMLDHDK